MTTINLSESQNLPFACLPRLYFLLFAIVALHLSRVLYKSTLFMQNKPNLPAPQMNTTACITRPYEALTPRPRRGYKPQSNPISKAAPMLLRGALLRTRLGRKFWGKRLGIKGEMRYNDEESVVKNQPGACDIFRSKYVRSFALGRDKI